MTKRQKAPASCRQNLSNQYGINTEERKINFLPLRHEMNDFRKEFPFSHGKKAKIFYFSFC